MASGGAQTSDASGFLYTRGTNWATPASGVSCFRITCLPTSGLGAGTRTLITDQSALAAHDQKVNCRLGTTDFRVSFTRTNVSDVIEHYWASKLLMADVVQDLWFIFDTATLGYATLAYIASDGTYMVETVAAMNNLNTLPVTGEADNAYSNPICIGANGSAENPFRGTMYNVEIRDAKPSDADIKTMMGQATSSYKAGSRYDRSHIIGHVGFLATGDITDDVSGLTWTASGNRTIVDAPSNVELQGRYFVQPDGTTGHDALMRTGFPTTNLSTAASLGVGHNSAASTGFTRPIIQFARDSRWASGDTCIAATLGLYCNLAAGGGTYNQIIQRCTRTGLIESTITYTVYHTALNWTTPFGDMGAASVTSALPLSTGAKTYDVQTLMAEGFAAGDSTHGFIIRRSDESTADDIRAGYDSSEGSTAGQRPSLEYWWARNGVGAAVNVPAAVSVPGLLSRGRGLTLPRFHGSLAVR